MSDTKEWWEDSYPARYYAYSNTASLLGGYPSVGWIDVSIYSSTSTWIPAAADMIALTEDQWNARSLGPQIVKDGAVVTYTPSTAVTLDGASTATAGTALTLTVGLNGTGPASAVTVNLSDGSACGKFSSNTLTFDEAGETTQTVTYTPAAAGMVAVSATNTGSLTNPDTLSITVSATS